MSAPEFESTFAETYRRDGLGFSFFLGAFVQRLSLREAIAPAHDWGKACAMGRKKLARDGSETGNGPALRATIRARRSSQYHAGGRR